MPELTIPSPVLIGCQLGNEESPCLVSRGPLHMSVVGPTAQSRDIGGFAPPLPAGYQFGDFACDFSLLCLVRGTSVKVKRDSRPGK